MTELLVGHIEWAAANAHLWGFALVFALMAIESSFIPFPSEVIMIPAGFLAFRGELTTGSPWTDLVLVVLCGTLGSLAGAYVNYFLSLRLGRPVLYRYGKYVLLKPPTLDRAEEIFNEYGDITTFVCRLIPAIRQLISIPAGLARMPLARFSFFTALGAGIWSAILAAIGFYFGTLAQDMTYRDLVYRGKDFLHDNYVWLFLALGVLIAVYAAVHHFVMKSPTRSKSNDPTG
jgi:membrane protein DedA with SNARE-associated domain